MPSINSEDPGPFKWFRETLNLFSAPKIIVFVYNGTQVVPKNVKSVQLLPEVEEIPDRAFQGRIKLECIVFNKGLKKIGKQAFESCTSLERIECPSTLIEIGICAFSECGKLKEVVLNKGLKKIGMAAFRHLRSLERIECPSALVDIEDNVFYDCIELKEVVLNEGLKRIGRGALNSCYSLEGIILPSTLVEIEKYAFVDCIELKEAVLNEGLAKIGAHAFNGCRFLEGITFPSTLLEIGTGAFAYCFELKEVVLNERVKQIEENAFDNCHSLGGLKFPSIQTHLDSINYDRDRVAIYNAINEIDYVSIEDGEVLISSVPLDGRNGWVERKESLDQILGLIAFVRLKEATTVLELALWKLEMEQTNKFDNVANRASCCIEVPGPVRDCILQFFPHNQLN
eukprot:CAMPEP_0183703586 /NCGR_PEP_ID=MMETSP0737-20130205/1284_1 /TAXON_ID=385413 /ORGANISM="Thalassiosira miniscula, Strain CCMP1093" /LENGTH=398 /DNA_ID=CAMNT_0025930371 /DNA_START=161 /DNA_END=1357 /DNA_ORIENTATION=-